MVRSTVLLSSSMRPSSMKRHATERSGWLIPEARTLRVRLALRGGTIEMRCKLGVARDIKGICQGNTGEFHRWQVPRIGVISSTA